MRAARKLLDKVKQRRPELVVPVEQLCSAFIDLAYHDVESHRRTKGMYMYM